MVKHISKIREWTVASIRSIAKCFSIGMLVLSPIAYGDNEPTLAPTEGEPSPTQQQQQQPPAQPTDNAKTYLYNLGTYMGYNLKVVAPSIVSALLESAQEIDDSQKNAISLLLGTIPGTSVVDSTNTVYATALNPLINVVYKKYISDSQSSSSDGGIKIVKEIDQMVDATPDPSSSSQSGPIYPSDPVSQSIANALVSPAYSTCTKSMIDAAPGGSASAFAQNCNRYQEAISTFVLGGIPSSMMPTQLDGVTLSQLNSNSLLAPLLYTTAPAQPSSGSGTATSSSGKGLVGNSQAQIAQNFIRYISVNVIPPKQLDNKTHSQLFSAATSDKIPAEQRLAAIKLLGNFFVIQRGFAALMSVGTSNLYDMLAKRMPQTITSPDDSDGKKPPPPTSVALNEYKMATRRLYDPSNTKANSSWVDQISTASPATVGKETAYLLAEMRYELYLARQMNERLLLTNSAMLFVLGQMLQAQSQPPTIGAIQQPS